MSIRKVRDEDTKIFQFTIWYKSRDTMDSPPSRSPRLSSSESFHYGPSYGLFPSLPNLSDSEYFELTRPQGSGYLVPPCISSESYPSTVETTKEDQSTSSDVETDTTPPQQMGAKKLVADTSIELQCQFAIEQSQAALELSKQALAAVQKFLNRDDKIPKFEIYEDSVESDGSDFASNSLASSQFGVDLHFSKADSEFEPLGTTYSSFASIAFVQVDRPRYSTSLSSSADSSASADVTNDLYDENCEPSAQEMKVHIRRLAFDSSSSEESSSSSSSENFDSTTRSFSSTQCALPQGNFQFVSRFSRSCEDLRGKKIIVPVFVP